MMSQEELEVEINTNYIEYNEEIDLFLLNEMKWLDKCALYIPLWTPQKHKKWINLVMLSLVIITTVINYLYDCNTLLKNGANVNAKSIDDDELPSDLTDSPEIKQLLSSANS